VTPTATAGVAAVVTTVLATVVPADFAADRSAQAWAKSNWARYRLKLAGLQIVATAIVALSAQRIGWTPEDDADGLSAVALGVSWSVAAVAVLRAEVPGFRVDTATPGFSLLRSFSGLFDSSLTESIRDSVRSIYGSADIATLQTAAYTAIARSADLQPDGTPTPSQVAYSATVTAYDPASANDLASCRRLIETLVVKHRLTRLS
jgi:hypothetical protein